MPAKQKQIEAILANNPIIPVVTIDDLSQVDEIYNKLSAKNIRCVEITLRTDVSWDAIRLFVEKYGHEFKVGVGTVLTSPQIEKCMSYGVDFMVSPGLSKSLVKKYERTGLAYLPGVSTPSEIMRGLSMGLRYFKFFPAEISGGVAALNTYGQVFSQATFCPTGGINEENVAAYQACKNVIAVGGSWVLK